MKHSQDNLTAASVQQAQAAAKQIAQLYATLKRKDATILELAKQNRELRGEIVQLKSGGALKQ
jgi:hypothetical protein